MTNSLQHREIYAGDDRTLSLAAVGAAGAPLDLTGYTLSLRLSELPGDTAVLTKAGTIVTAATGAFSVALTAAETAALDGDYWYHVLATSGAGAKLTVAGGHLRVRKPNQV